ncbi:MAG: hypothetical protein ACRDUV_03780 [Pseudonocardiaceae bacterium]
MMRVYDARTQGGIMRLQRLAKDADSYAVGGCHAMYLAENGLFTAQSDLVDADTHANLESVLPGEGAIFIKPEVVIDAVARYLGRLP